MRHTTYRKARISLVSKHAIIRACITARRRRDAAPAEGQGPGRQMGCRKQSPWTQRPRTSGRGKVVSNSAGTFVCNHVFYGLMHLAATRRLDLRGGFLHVPYLPEQAARHDGAPSMALDDVVRGIEIVLTVAAMRNDDGEAAKDPSWGTIS